MSLDLDASINLDIGGSGGQKHGTDATKRAHVKYDEDIHTPLPLYDKVLGVLYLASAATGNSYRLDFDKRPATGRIWSLLNMLFIVDDEFSAVPTGANGFALYAGVADLNPIVPYTAGQFAGNIGDLIYANKFGANTPALGFAAPSVTTFPADTRFVSGNQQLYGLVNFTGNVASPHGYFCIIEYADWPAEGKIAHQLAGHVHKHPSHHHPSATDRAK